MQRIICWTTLFGALSIKASWFGWSRPAASSSSSENVLSSPSIQQLTSPPSYRSIKDFDFSSDYDFGDEPKINNEEDKICKEFSCIVSLDSGKENSGDGEKSNDFTFQEQFELILKEPASEPEVMKTNDITVQEQFEFTLNEPSGEIEAEDLATEDITEEKSDSEASKVVKTENKMPSGTTLGSLTISNMVSPPIRPKRKRNKTKKNKESKPTQVVPEVKQVPVKNSNPKIGRRAIPVGRIPVVVETKRPISEETKKPVTQAKAARRENFSEKSRQKVKPNRPRPKRVVIQYPEPLQKEQMYSAKCANETSQNGSRAELEEPILPEELPLNIMNTTEESSDLRNDVNPLEWFVSESEYTDGTKSLINDVVIEKSDVCDDNVVIKSESISEGEILFQDCQFLPRGTDALELRSELIEETSETMSEEIVFTRRETPSEEEARETFSVHENVTPNVARNRSGVGFGSLLEVESDDDVFYSCDGCLFPQNWSSVHLRRPGLTQTLQTFGLHSEVPPARFDGFGRVRGGRGMSVLPTAALSLVHDWIVPMRQGRRFRARGSEDSRERPILQDGESQFELEHKREPEPSEGDSLYAENHPSLVEIIEQQRHSLFEGFVHDIRKRFEKEPERPQVSLPEEKEDSAFSMVRKRFRTFFDTSSSSSSSSSSDSFGTSKSADGSNSSKMNFGLPFFGRRRPTKDSESEEEEVSGLFPVFSYLSKSIERSQRRKPASQVEEKSFLSRIFS